MSCPDPLVLAAYAAGDLAALERRDAEVHLVRCKKCRAHVLDLREVEARTAQAAAVAAEEPAPEPSGWGLAVGFLVALGAVALALAALGRMSGSPLRLSGVYAMAFDLIFFVRGRAPGLIELVVALAATGTVAAIAALGVASLARRLGPPLLAALAIVGAEPAQALDLRHAEGTLQIPASEVVAGSLAACTLPSTWPAISSRRAHANTLPATVPAMRTRSPVTKRSPSIRPSIVTSSAEAASEPATTSSAEIRSVPSAW
ncbi:MAG TPA: hypothetical protein VNE71_10825, partial [Myxococcota bacterium]|nr:hypothetical protein [Myxococcota bacterium]